LRLTSVSVQTGMIEVSGGETRIVLGKKPIRPVIKTLARYVHIIGIENAVHESRDHPTRAKDRCSRNDLREERARERAVVRRLAGRRIKPHVPRRLGHIVFETVFDELHYAFMIAVGGKSLKR